MFIGCVKYNGFSVFFEKTQKAFAFHFIEKRDSLLQASEGQRRQAKMGSRSGWAW
jgi:hypothetical protein